MKSSFKIVCPFMAAIKIFILEMIPRAQNVDYKILMKERTFMEQF